MQSASIPVSPDDPQVTRVNMLSAHPALAELAQVGFSLLAMALPLIVAALVGSPASFSAEPALGQSSE